MYRVHRLLIFSAVYIVAICSILSHVCRIYFELYEYKLFSVKSSRCLFWQITPVVQYSVCCASCTDLYIFKWKKRKEVFPTCLLDSVTCPLCEAIYTPEIACFINIARHHHHILQHHHQHHNHIFQRHHHHHHQYDHI